MNKLKPFALAAVAFAAFASFAAATASATELNSISGTYGTGTTIAASAEGTTVLHPPIGDIECEESKVEGKTTNAGGSSETVKGNIETLTFSKCNATVTVLKKGTLEVHTRTSEEDLNGTLTSSGAEVTVVFVGFHCIFSTNSTDLGTVTGSGNTGGNATLDIEATIPRTGGSSGIFCGSEAEWTGSYKVSSPSHLDVDRVCFQLAPGLGDYTTEMDCNTKQKTEEGKGEWERRFH